MASGYDHFEAIFEKINELEKQKRVRTQDLNNETAQHKALRDLIERSDCVASKMLISFFCSKRGGQGGRA